MRNYKVEGWILIKIPVSKKIDADSEDMAKQKVVKLIENYTAGEIQDLKLEAIEAIR